MEVDPRPNVPSGEHEAGGGDAPEASLEGILTSPFQKSSVSAFRGEECRGPGKCLKCHIGHILSESTIGNFFYSK